MATVLPTNIAAIIAAIQAELVVAAPAGYAGIVQYPSQLGLSANNILLVADDDPPTIQGNREVLLRPRGLLADREFVEASGRVDRRVRRRLSVIVRTLLRVDPVDSDAQFLTDAANGHYALEEAVWNILDTFLPIDANNNALCFEPIHPLPTTEARRDRKNAGWGWSACDFEVPYILALDQSRQ